MTLRNCRALIECRYDALVRQPAKIGVTAIDCVLAPQTAVFACRGPQSPQPLLAMVQWSGRSSLLAENAAVAVWELPGQTPQAMDDSNIAIDGLARSRLEFAGNDAANPAASRVVRWSAPSSGGKPPGIGPLMLAPP